MIMLRHQSHQRQDHRRGAAARDPHHQSPDCEDVALHWRLGATLRLEGRSSKNPSKQINNMSLS
jgi:hypothetical protein